MSQQLLAYLAMAVGPFFLSSNLIIGAVAVRTMEPFTLTFFRWGLAFLIILPLAWKPLYQHRKLLLSQWRLIFIMAFMGMGVSGAGVYMGLKHTTATNGTLIYASSPVLIILMERLFRGRPVSTREIVGVLLAIIGIVMIVCKGSLEALLAIHFELGDLLFVCAATSWAIYTLLLKSKVFDPVPTIGMFAVVGGVGALIQVPVVIWEVGHFNTLPTQGAQWASLLGLALVSSVLALLTYQFAIRVLGPATASMVMYLMPAVGVVLAVLFLGESFKAFHAAGLLLVMSGVILCTFPKSLLNRWRKKAAVEAE